jgi:hypothetical protein
VDLQVEQPVLELFELVFVVVLVDRIVVHLDLVEARPLAHQSLRWRIVTVPESGGNAGD